MGSTASKACCSHSSPSSSSSKGPRSRPNWPFPSSCLGASSGSRHLPPQDHQNNEGGGDETESESDELKIDFDPKVKNDMSSCISSNVEVDAGSSGRSSSTPTRFLSRFSFIPGNLSFRLSRAASLGSSRAYPDDQDLRLRSGPAAPNFLDRIEAQQGSGLLPPSLINGQDSLTNFRLNGENLDDNRMMSSGDGGTATRVGVDRNVHSPRVANELDNIGTRRFGPREPVERNVRFSRTLSVGRLRDRVLRRSSLTDFTLCPMQQEREVGDARQSSRRYAFDGDTRIPTSEANAGASPTVPAYPPSSMSSSLFGIQDTEETSRSREARYHDLLEHRSNFLERRRRIRSQVRALQRLGSRFENLSGHERSCILSGQHRTGRCTCRASNREASSTDDTNTRASISRIVMLAEALFEVLDEIHQQSVVLSSRPSMSSIGSIPAPNEAVESLPVKHYTKSQKHHNEEVAQCYICLVEYEEGDSVRILPCHHEFHRTCVDKWLKEIHRVCPLCRGDICKYDLLPPEN